MLDISSCVFIDFHKTCNNALKILRHNLLLTTVTRLIFVQDGGVPLTFFSRLSGKISEL